MSSFQDSINYILSYNSTILQGIPPDKIQDVITLLLGAHRVFVYGTGRSGLLGRAFAIRLVHLGIQTFVIGETITAPVQKDDCVVLISGSGKTIPVVMTAEIAANLGAKIILITTHRGSPIAKFSTVVIPFKIKKNNPCLAPLGTLFEANTWIFLDGIIAELMSKKGENESSMKQRHATLE